MRQSIGWMLILLVSVWFMSCKPSRPDALFPDAFAGSGSILLAPDAYPEFIEHNSRGDLLQALDRQLEHFETNGNQLSWTLGDRVYTKGDVIDTLRSFRKIWVDHRHEPETLNGLIRERFDVYRMAASENPNVLITGYFSPVYRGAQVAGDPFLVPLYRRPDDLVTIDTAQFPEQMMRKGSLERSSTTGRLVDDARRIVPYYDRRAIDGEGALRGKGLELAFLNRYMDQFLFHVQGGGFVQLPDGRLMRLVFAGKNGHPYTSIGRLLVDEGKIPKDEISIPAIEAYFRDNPTDMQRVCFTNASYVFYHWDGRLLDELSPEDYPTGVLGLPVTPGRSIATDKRYFPGGGLMFVSGEQRQNGNRSLSFACFTLDQDTGGAIRGAHIDLYQGAGKEAGERAGLLKDDYGSVFILMIKR